MIELQLLGVGADGESVVFTDDNGERYVTPITDELRASLRRDRPALQVHPSVEKPSLRPSEIQRLLRAGMTAAEISAEHHVDIAFILKFEPPIRTEKTYILSYAQDTHIGAPDGPKLGELVIDRLAARGVSPSSLVWSARREQSMPWEITVTFVQGAQEMSAHWSYEMHSSTVVAIDQEARWLTETPQSAPLQTIFSPVSAGFVSQFDSEDVRQREALVDQLNAARGKRVDIDVDLDEPSASESELLSVFSDESDTSASRADISTEEHGGSASISARIYSLAQARTKKEAEASSVLGDDDASDSQGVSDTLGQTKGVPGVKVSSSRSSAAGLLSSDEASGQALPSESIDALPGFEEVVHNSSSPKAPEKKRTKRRSVPSWDEIVFGSKP